MGHPSLARLLSFPRAAAIAASIALAAASTAGAATTTTAASPASIGDLARGADTVILGSVTQKQAHWEGKKIVTEYQVTVRRTFKGDDAESLTVVEPGGEVEQPFPVAMRVEGVPDLEAGGDVVLFLKRDANGALSVFGLSQGAIAVQTTDKPDARFVIREGHRVKLDVFLHDLEEAVRTAVVREPR
jgi:hypothetical protein